MIVSQKKEDKASCEVLVGCRDTSHVSTTALSLPVHHVRRLKSTKALGKATCLEVLCFIDTALDFYCDPQRCGVCEAVIDHWFAVWHARAAAAEVPMGVIYKVLCDGAYFKTLDTVFHRRNGWAKEAFYSALSLSPQLRGCWVKRCDKVPSASSACRHKPGRSERQSAQHSACRL